MKSLLGLGGSGITLLSLSFPKVKWYIVVEGAIS